MRVHGDVVIRRREKVGKLKDYRDARILLREDFSELCGYCGKNGKNMHEKFHIDHFIPVSLSKEHEKDYYNLVWTCPKCNRNKSDKWPTGDITQPNDGVRGWIDPATEDFDKHIERNEQGFVVGVTPLGKSMCSLLKLDIRRSDLFWKISQLYLQQEELENLQKERRLSEEELDFYIESNKLLKQYINEAFEAGE